MVRVRLFTPEIRDITPEVRQNTPEWILPKTPFFWRKQNQGDSSAVWTYPKSDLAPFSVPSKEGNPSLIFGSTADYKLFPFEFVCLQLANVEQHGQDIERRKLWFEPFQNHIQTWISWKIRPYWRKRPQALEVPFESKGWYSVKGINKCPFEDIGIYMLVYVCTSCNLLECNVIEFTAVIFLYNVCMQCMLCMLCM